MPAKTCPFIEETVFENQSLGEGKSIMGIYFKDPVTVRGNRIGSSGVCGPCGDRGWRPIRGFGLVCFEGVRARKDKQQPPCGKD
jgi:hypothetical protein